MFNDVVLSFLKCLLKANDNSKLKFFCNHYKYPFSINILISQTFFPPIAISVWIQNLKQHFQKFNAMEHFDHNYFLHTRV